MFKKWLAPFFLILLTTVFLLLWESPPERFLPDALFGQAQPQTPTASYPTNILVNTRSRRYDSEGQLSSVISASRTRFYQSVAGQPAVAERTEIENPDITLITIGSPPWKATADSGRTTENGQVVELMDNVKLRQTESTDRAVELTTTHLLIKPEQQYAETDKPVTIRSVNDITHATGMRAYLEQDRIQLLSNVRGIYEPNR
ncbi:MAG: LPS export ABC transporter periplasmic protein LptC [Gammaproteobacteria bacterium]|uniref:LPS export ABC transporter periplasmic protein LptC n=1 Tax=Pseudomaricurvus alcaniphilus TaxID=1166482 RepID=UPI00140D8DF9|nr:LPS export ABC transporter periplasmic protein LptC [Pseudomaricurvus alcaniphilus]MBR9910535.1 LPS export ABC transporter periplasmic protein LptC [Gammaproteobacteria bacterium]NHN39666.1 LPS export ABC transporter periplasmic protein LptC [Pseudomaricurvus alcaniphilus]